MTMIDHYLLLRPLGEGASAEVWEAQAPDGTSVALKWCHLGDGETEARARRERTALALLDLRGIVRLRDHGVHQGRPYVVTDIVRGQPFPGPDPSWPALERITRGLLETLARVHALGIVHRDLKPANVWIDPAGKAVVLDFGLASGEALGARVTTSGTVVGTPLYLSPEQLNGDPYDGRADLYAVGVMLYEVLAGHPPHPTKDFSTLWIQRLTRAAPSLAAIDGVPSQAVRLVDSLLQRSSRHRPDAVAALTLLEGPSAEGALPFLGSEHEVQRLLSAVRAGTRAEVTGPSGAGKTRHLERVATLVDRPILKTRPATAALGSLPGDLAGPDAARTHLAEHAEAGGMVLVDDVDGIDRWTIGLIEDYPGPVISSRTSNTSTLPALGVPALRALFVGSDRIFQTRTDAAVELYARTRGLPRDVVRELRRWVTHGLASRETDGWRVTREALDTLAAGAAPTIPGAHHPDLEPELAEHLSWTNWIGPAATASRVARISGVPSWRAELERQALVDQHLIFEVQGRVRCRMSTPHMPVWKEAQRIEAHAQTASVLPPGTPARLEHAIAAGEVVVALAELDLRVKTHLQTGHHKKALADLQRVARSGLSMHGCAWVPLITSAAVAAVSLNTPRALADALGLCAQVGERVDQVAEMVRCRRDLTPRTAGVVARRLDAIGFADSVLEHLRLGIRVSVARHVGLDAEAAFVQSIDTEHALGWAAAKRLTWHALLRRRQGDDTASIALHTQALALRETASGRLSTLTNLVDALIWLPDLEAATALAERGTLEARRTRHFGYGAIFARQVRIIVHRRGGTTPDLELAKELHRLDIVFTEAMIACRGAHPSAHELVRQALALAETEGSSNHRLHCQAMGVFLGLWDCPHPDAMPDDPSFRADVQALLGEVLLARPALFTGVLT